MDVFRVPRILISGVSSGTGKSLIGVGLSVALRKRNLSVSCCVNGPNLVQGVIYHRISRRPVRTFDERILSPNQILEGLCHAGVGADIILIEGRDGLYDGESPGILRGSDAELAALTRTPVILTVDMRAMGSSVVALVKGFREFARGFDVAAILANRVEKGDHAGVRDKVFYDVSLQSSGYEPLVGAIPELEYEIPIPRGINFACDASPTLPMQFYVDIGNIVGQYVDIEQLMKVAERAAGLKTTGLNLQPSVRRCKIAVTDDSCFNLAFQDNVDLLRFFGAEIVPFSPLADSALPRKIGGLYLTSGDLVEYGRELSENEDLKRSIFEFAKSGGVIYSEGAGTAFLCARFRLDPSGAWLGGVGVIPGSASRCPASFAYTEAATAEESIFGRRGLIFKGVTKADWKFEIETRAIRALRVSHGARTPENEGFSPGAQILNTGCLNHFGSNPVIAKNIVDAAEVVFKV